MPKSITFGIGAPSCSITSTFDGFRSRWITPFWCAWWTAAADREEQGEPFLGGHPLAVAILGDGAPSMYSMTKYGRPFAVAPASRMWAMFGMVHHRQRLALVVEAGEHLAGVHPELHDLEGDAPANGFTLLGEVHGAHAAFAERADDLIAAEVVVARPRQGPMAWVWGRRPPEELSRAAWIRHAGHRPAGSAGPSSAPHRRQVGIWTKGEPQAARGRPFYCVIAAACNLRGRDALFAAGAPDRAPAA